MKELPLLLVWYLLLMCTIETTAQAPQKMSYQMVVRNSTNAIVANQQVGVRISLLQGSATGSPVYEETHTPTTNANGLASLVIGDGIVVTGSIANINWANGPYFIKTETDPTGGTNYSITGTSQLLSVPYALYAENTRSNGSAYLVLQGELTNAEAAAIIEAQAGSQTQFVWIKNTSGVTQVNLSRITNLVELIIENNANLEQVTIPQLAEVHSKFLVTQNPSLQNLQLPTLQRLQFSSTVINNNNALAELVFPSMTSAGNTSIGGSSLAHVNMPVLTKINQGGVNFFISTGAPIGIINLPLLEHVDTGTLIIGGSFLQQPVLPELKTVNQLSIVAKGPLLLLPKLHTANTVYLSNSRIDTFRAPLLQTANTILTYASKSHSFEFNSLIQCGTINIQDSTLTNISLPQLAAAGDINLANLNLVSPVFPVLSEVNTFLINGSSLTSVSLSALKKVNQKLYISGLNVTAVQLPLLDSVRLLSILGTNLTTLSLPSLKKVHSVFEVKNNPNLANISVPLITSMLTENPIVGYLPFTVRENKLSSAQVNSLLSILVNAVPPVKSRQLVFLAQSPPAPPTGQGLTDKATLQARPNIVQTD